MQGGPYTSYLPTMGNDGKTRMRRWMLRTGKTWRQQKPPKCLLLCVHTHAIFLPLSTGWSASWKYFNLFWLRLIMSYHRFNNLTELLNGDLAAKIRQIILSKDLMDRECNYSLPSKVNRKLFYEGKCRNVLVYKVKCSTCNAMYIGKTYQTLKKHWMVISPISFTFSRMDKNRTHFCPFWTAL